MPAKLQRARPLPPAERRAALIAATIPLLEQHGPTVSVREIAAAAGIAEGTIFRVFPDKDALIRGVVESVFDPEQLVTDLAEVDLGLPLDERLALVVRILQRRMRQIFKLIEVLRLSKQRPDHEQHRRNRAEHDALIAEAIARIINPDADQLRCAPVEAARMLRLMMFASSHPLVSDDPPLTAEQIVTLLLDGVRQHPTTPQGNN